MKTFLALRGAEFSSKAGNNTRGSGHGSKSGVANPVLYSSLAGGLIKGWGTRGGAGWPGEGGWGAKVEIVARLMFVGKGDKIGEKI